MNFDLAGKTAIVTGAGRGGRGIGRGIAVALAVPSNMADWFGLTVTGGRLREFTSGPLVAVIVE